MFHGAHVEMRGDLLRVGSLLPLWVPGEVKLWSSGLCDGNIYCSAILDKVFLCSLDWPPSYYVI